MDLLRRPRRNRKNKVVRRWLADTDLRRSQLIYPVFIVEGKEQKQEIKSLPGQYRWSVDLLPQVCEQAQAAGVGGIALFPAIEETKKTEDAKEALNPDNLVCRALDTLKKVSPETMAICDLALDPFSSMGHDGLVKDGKILNDETVEMLAKMAVIYAQKGADIVAPSDMMDGRVLAIREELDDASFEDVQIISYSAKYASAFYGPFREALDSQPRFGDKRTYQLSPRNRREALLECELDEQEGADILMVKPALAYLDIIRELRNSSLLPIAAYNVSGEYAMIKAAANKGWLDEKQAIGEMLLSIRRAGADIIFTYFALSEFHTDF
ncbi:MAG: porphobilinogen synthase [Bdellovibrionales bacterium]|nr:porphobilinogen synthase [Bdellovibrionales bacterium]